MSIEAIKQMVHELEYVLDCINNDEIPFDGDDFHEALRLGRQAIAEAEKQEPDDLTIAYMAGFYDGKNTPQRKPEQEPVAWMDEYGDVLSASFVDGNGLRNIPLYTTPQKRTWVGLTEEDKNDCLVSADPCECLAKPESHQLMEDVEAKLRELNT